MDANQEIFNIIGSRNRLKILNYLIENGPAHISKIAGYCGINYTGANNHLQTLLKSGLIKEVNYGRIRFFEPRIISLELLLLEGEELALYIVEVPGETVKLGESVQVEHRFKLRKPKTKYPLTVGSRLRELVKSRDDHKCVLCGMGETEHVKQYNTTLIVHHINLDRTHNYKENLVTLCKSCHVRTHKHKYKEELTKKIKEYIKTN